MTTTQTTWQSIPGTEIRVGDRRYAGWALHYTVVSVRTGGVPNGARYADVTTSDGETQRCWEGFLYRVGR
jgi:hypothetical protein